MGTALRALWDILSVNAVNWRKTWSMAIIQFNKRYSGATFGALWSIVKPTLFILVFWFGISVGIRGGKAVGDIPYLDWLLPGILPWFFMSDALVLGGGAIRANKQLVTKTLYPASTIPTFTLISLLFSHLVLVAIMAVILAFSGTGLSIYAIQVFYYMFCMFALMFVLSILFAGLVAVSKDFEHLLKSVNQVLFWLTPILWNIKELSPKAKLIGKAALLNPMAYIVQGYRDSFIYHSWFTFHWKYTLYFWVFIFLLALLASFVYKKLEREFADIL